MPQFGTYEPESVHILDWITNYEEIAMRVAAFGATPLPFDDFPDEVSKSTDAAGNADVSKRLSTQSGSLTQNLPDYIHNSTYTPRPPLGVKDRDDSSIAGTYQMTTCIWTVTSSTNSGTYTYVFGVQDFNL